MVMVMMLMSSVDLMIATVATMILAVTKAMTIRHTSVRLVIAAGAKCIATKRAKVIFFFN
jgi:hypothetical protein